MDDQERNERGTQIILFGLVIAGMLLILALVWKL